MPKVFGYVRVSTEGQVKSGLSQAAQKEKIKAHFEYALKDKGFEWGQFYEDAAVSGKTDLIRRDQGKLLNHFVSPGDMIVFSRLDRGFRNTRDLLNTVESWTQRGVQVIFLDLQFDTSTAIGMLMVKIIGAVADFERSLLSQRICEARRQAVLEGRIVGNTKILFKIKRIKGKAYSVPNEHDQAQARMLLKMHLEGHSYERIYWHCRKAGVLRSTGKEWDLSGIKLAVKAIIDIIAKEEAEKKNQANGHV